MRHRLGCWSLIVLALLSAPAHADDNETRQFDILVDGKVAGQSILTLVQKEDGSAYMKGTADVKLQTIIPYSLHIEAQEWWKDGKLIALKCSSQENKKRNEVVVSANGQQLVVNANGQARPISADSWTNSYWKLADARFHNRDVPILETDTGIPFVARLSFKGTDKITVGNQLQDCFHFQVAAPQGPIDLWYDRYHRLVRQQFVESGHETIVQINAIRR